MPARVPGEEAKRPASRRRPRVAVKPSKGGRRASAPSAFATPSNVAERVAEEIRTLVARGELRSGDALPPEAELMEQYGVARPTMREALRILESDGVLVQRRGLHGGPRIRDIDLSALARRAGLYLQVKGTTLADIIEAQSVMEPEAVALAAERGTDEEIDQLEVLIDQAEAAGDLVEFSQRAADFHAALVRMSGNQTLTMYSELSSAVIRHQYEQALRKMDPDHGRDITDLSLRWYRGVLERIRARDPKAAADYWRRHQAAATAMSQESTGGRRQLDLYS